MGTDYDGWHSLTTAQRHMMWDLERWYGSAADMVRARMAEHPDETYGEAVEFLHKQPPPEKKWEDDQ